MCHPPHSSVRPDHPSSVYSERSRLVWFHPAVTPQCLAPSAIPAEVSQESLSNEAKMTTRRAVVLPGHCRSPPSRGAGLRGRSTLLCRNREFALATSHDQLAANDVGCLLDRKAVSHEDLGQFLT